VGRVKSMRGLDDDEPEQNEATPANTREERSGALRRETERKRRGEKEAKRERGRDRTNTVTGVGGEENEQERD